MFRSLTLLIAFGALAGCTPPAEISADDLGPTLDTGEIVSGANDSDVMGGIIGPQGSISPGEADKIAHRHPPAFDHLLLTPERATLLPFGLRQNPRLASLALAKSLENPTSYQGGVLGFLGPAKVFVTTLDHIRDDARLYWVMVKVLSEKYGCFM